MRVLLLADVASGHTEKWALGLAAKGITVGIFSFNKSDYKWFKDQQNIDLLFEPESENSSSGFIEKIAYLKHLSLLKRKVIEFKPDILHAHYASSYGLLGALCGFHPFVISAWGTDVMKFPQENFILKAIVKYNLKKADIICATSNTINEYIQAIIQKPVQIIPFGVDMEIFKENKSLKSKDKFVIGAIKSLEKIYNINVLIEAFAIVSSKHSQAELMIVGDGSERRNLENLVKQLKLENYVIFIGKVPFKETPNYFNKLNCLVNISQYESFGVSVIEAMACKVPVIVTNVGGLKEVVMNNEMGFLVEPSNIEQTATAIEKIMMDKDYSESIVEKAYQSVKARFNWESNLNTQIKVYQDLLKK
jgi:glycosyltransferase involved in cell wall biosynthesis